MPIVNPEIVTNPVEKLGGKFKLSPEAPTVATTPGDPPPPPAITVPEINGVPQTQLPYPAKNSYLSNAIR
jgi:hypothetical protein